MNGINVVLSSVDSMEIIMRPSTLDNCMNVVISSKYWGVNVTPSSVDVTVWILYDKSDAIFSR